MGLMENAAVLISNHNNNEEGMVMITLTIMIIKLAIWVVLLPLKIMLLPLTILSGGSKQPKHDSSDDAFLMSAVLLDETIDDYWWDA